MRQKITPKAVLIPTVSLFLICIFVTAALALTNSVTADKIAEIEQQSKQESMKAVCPEAQTFEEITPDVMYEGKDESGKTVGYAISTATMGYGGQVKVMTGVNDGKIIGVDVFYNDAETPGLGARTRDELCDLFARKLEEGRQDDLRRQQTLVGPQRDDIAFTIDGRDARVYGSQGQQRSIVLAWKMAEVRLSQEVVGEQPLLLLDDVMSELDEGRRDAMTRFVQSGIQTVVTTTNLGYFPEELLLDAKVVKIDE